MKIKNACFQQGTEYEQKYLDSVAEQVDGLLFRLLWTTNIPSTLDCKWSYTGKMKNRKFECNITPAAIEATALAIHDVTPSNQDTLTWSNV
jgi:hypothetical protein